MALSNTAVPIYYGKFRDTVLRGEVPVCRDFYADESNRWTNREPKILL